MHAFPKVRWSDYQALRLLDRSPHPIPRHSTPRSFPNKSPVSQDNKATLWLAMDSIEDATITRNCRIISIPPYPGGVIKHDFAEQAKTR